MTGTNTRRKSNLMFKRLPKGANGGIQLLLIHNVEHLGKQGELVEVKAGYALNYLLPQGLATVATEHHRRMVEKHREKLRAIELEKLSEYRVLADELGKQSITIEANANDEGHLYGSVGAQEIVDASLKVWVVPTVAADDTATGEAGS
jgi:large subunit ribosomal protein L9